MNDFMIKIMAGLDKALSKRMINNDLKSLDGQFTIKVAAKLNKALSQRALKQALKELANLNVNVNAKLNKSSSEAQLKQQVKALQAKIKDLDLRLKANTNQLNEAVRQAASSAQRVADQVPIEYKVSIKKDKLINDLSLLAKQNSKLFTNTAATQKYGKLLDDAYGATTGGDIQALTLRMAAFKSELKATNLSGLTLADTFKKTVGRAGELVSATSMVMIAYSQAREAYKEIKELDDSMTSLYKVADEIRSRDDFPAYLDRAIAKAKELSVETKSLISSVTDWKKIGFSLGLSEELAEVSTKLEKTGDMSIDKATGTLISTLQAFKEIDGLTEDQYNERALAIADKINNISNTRSIDAEGISDALQNSVATLQEANNDLNQSIAMIAAGNKIFQSPSEVGNMLKVVSMRLRGVSEDGEQAEESVAKLRDTILNLTNDKVDIMLDKNTFKSTYDILLEISKVYDSLSDKSQALLLEKIAGKQRGASTAALLQNMSEAEAIYQDALNSTGSVNKEFERYQESASAAVTRFKETLVDTYTSILNGDMIRNIADTGSVVLDLANKFNLLQSSIIGITAVGVTKGIIAIGTACVSSAKQMSSLGDAINRVYSLPTDKKRKAELVSIGEATRGLSDKQNKLLLSNKNLQTSDRMNILAGQGVVKSKREEKLATLGLTEATDAQTVANVKATTSTFSLKAAVTGLGATMKSIFMSNPIGISLMALSVTVGAVAGRYREYRQQLEETRQKNIEAADSASVQAKKLEGLYNQYVKLASVSDKTSAQEDEFKTVIEDITASIGKKAEALEGLTVGTEEYTQALKNATQAELESQLATAIIGRKSAEENLHDDTWSTWSGSRIDVPLNINMTGVEEHVKALDIVRDVLHDFERQTSDGIDWMPTDYNDMSKVAEYYYALIEARDKLAIQSKELNDDNLLSSDIYKNLDTSISKISDSMEVYTQKKYEELKLEYEFHNGIPTTVDGFNSMESAILSASGAGEKLQGVFKGLIAEDYSALSVEAAQSKTKTSGTGFESVIFTEEQNKQIDNFQKSLSTLAAAIDKIKDKSLTGSELLDLQQDFPSLINSTEDLDVALEGLVDDTLARTIDFLESAGASDGLINTFKQIANEAKSIESVDWDGTFDVFDNANKQMQSLANMVKDLGNSYTLTAEEARKYSEVFPELLSQGEITSTGIIQFNRQVIDDFVNGKKSEIQADRDTQITKLENQKSIIEGQMAVAQAELELIEAQGNAKIDAENQTNEAVAEARDNLVQHLVDIGLEEGNADALVKELMAGNVQEYDRVVADVSNNVSDNLSDSASNAATNVGNQSKMMIESLFGVANQAANTAKAIAGIGSGNPVDPAKVSINGGAAGSAAFSASKVQSDFKKQVQTSLDIDRYEKTDRKVKLEVDISNYQQSIADIDSQINLLKSSEKELDKYLPDGSKGGGKGSSKKETEKDFDWIDRKMQLLEDKRQELIGKASSADIPYLGLDEQSFSQLQDYFVKTEAGIALTSEEFYNLGLIADKTGISVTNLFDELKNGGFESRRGYMAQALEVDRQILEECTSDAEYYSSLYGNAASKLSDDLRIKVENGGVDIQTLTGEEAENVERAIEAYDRKEQAYQKAHESQKQYSEDMKAYAEIELEYLDKQAESIEHRNNMIQKQIDYLIASGNVVNASAYESLMANLQQQEAILNKKIALRKKELQRLMDSGEIHEGDERYFELQEYIESCEESLADLAIKQEEYNDKIRQLPIENMQKVINMYEDISKALQDYANVMEASGKKLDAEYFQRQLVNGRETVAQYKEQAELIRDIMDEYEVGSDKYTEMYNKLQDINSAISNIAQNMHEWNKELLALPLNSMNNRLDGLGNVLSALQDVQSDHEVVINAVTSAIQKQIEALEEQRDLGVESAQAEIDALQEKLDLLQEQNKERQIQLALEQARYDLERAQNQKTNKVVRDGIIDYEADQDAIRNANQSKADAEYNKVVHDLEKQKEALEDNLEAIEESYQKQIDLLNEMAEKWSKIKTDAEDTANAAIADQYLGSGWQDKVTSGNDGSIYEAFKKSYETNNQMVQKYEKQIESTEKIYNLLNSYIAAYQAGTLSYEEAMSSIKSLLSQMNKDMSAGQAVQNVIDYLAKVNDTEANADAVLSGIQAQLKADSDEMIKNLEQYNENLDLIAGCMTSWEQLTSNIGDIRNLMDKVIDSIDNGFDDLADALGDYSRRRDEEEDDDDYGDHSSGTVSPGGTSNDHYTGNDVNTSGSQDNDHGPGVKSYAKGIENGAVGSKIKITPEEFEQLQRGADETIRRFKNGEVPIIAHEGEVVFNPDQQRALLDNLNYYRQRSFMIPSSQGMSLISGGSRETNIDINVGGITLTDVRDVDGLTKGIMHNLEPSMRQRFLDRNSIWD